MAAALVLLVLLVTPASALAANGSIAGTVTATAGGALLTEIEVCAYELGEEEIFECAETDFDGTYSIERLAPADYKVEFWPPAGVNLSPEYYDNKTSWSDADLVGVADGAETPGIDAALEEGGWIEGQVVDAGTKLGLEEIVACAFPIDETGFGRCAVTAADGSYEILGLRTDSYEVGFFPLEEEGEYLSQYYDGKSFWFEATPVLVTAGAGVDEIDAALQKAGRVAGTVTDALSSAGVGSSLVCLLDAFEGEIFECDFTGPGGKYEIGEVPAGTYKAWFSPDIPEWELEDDYFQQFYNGKPSFAQANPIAVGSGAVVSGIDARLVSRKAPPSAARPVTPPAITAPVKPRPPIVKRCPKGKRKVKRNGKVRCVKKGKRKKHEGRAAGRANTERQVAGRPLVPHRP